MCFECCYLHSLFSDIIKNYFSILFLTVHCSRARCVYYDRKLFLFFKFLLNFNLRKEPYTVYWELNVRLSNSDFFQITRNNESIVLFTYRFAFF